MRRRSLARTSAVALCALALSMGGVAYAQTPLRINKGSPLYIFVNAEPGAQRVVIHGEGFKEGAALSVDGNDVTVASMVVASPQRIEASLYVSDVAQRRPRDLVVTNPDGERAVCERCLYVAHLDYLPTVSLVSDPGTVVWSGSVRLTGVVQEAPPAAYPARIMVMFSTDPRRDTHVLDVGTTDPEGRFDLRVVPPASGFFTVITYPARSASAVSQAVPVFVRASITLNPVAQTIERGRTAWLTGTVFPAGTDGEVVLQLLEESGRWRNVKRQSSAAGQFRIGFAPRSHRDLIVRLTYRPVGSPSHILWNVARSVRIYSR